MHKRDVCDGALKYQAQYIYLQMRQTKKEQIVEDYVLDTHMYLLTNGVSAGAFSATRAASSLASMHCSSSNFAIPPPGVICEEDTTVASTIAWESTPLGPESPRSATPCATDLSGDNSDGSATAFEAAASEDSGGASHPMRGAQKSASNFACRSPVHFT